MPTDYTNEPYVRLYKKKSINWKMMPWQGKVVLRALFTEFDRAGLLELGEHGVKGLATLLELPIDVVAPGLEALLENKTVVLLHESRTLFMPNFMDAQDAPSSDAQRKRDERERARARAKLEMLTGLPASVTKRDTESQNVTKSHDESRDVTRGHSDPDPDHTGQDQDPTHSPDARARVGEDEQGARAAQLKLPDAPPLWFQDAWKERAGIKMLGPGVLIEPWRCVEDYARAAGQSCEEVAPGLLDAFGAVQSSWSSEKHRWSAHLFVKHFEAVQRQALMPKTARAGPGRIDPLRGQLPVVHVNFGKGSA